MAKIAGMAFMAVHDGQGDAAIVRWCLIAFQASVDLVNRLPQLACIHLGVYVSHGFGAGHGMAQPMFPEAGCARHLQSVEASHPRPEQDYGRFGYGGRGDAGFRPAVGGGGPQFGDILNEALHLLVVRHGLAHSLAPWLGDADLAKFAGMTLHQVHRLVQLALGAMAVGFAALAGTFRKSAPKEPLAGGQLGNAGAEVAFGGREFGADEGLGHVLYHILYKIGMESKSKNATEEHTSELQSR